MIRYIQHMSRIRDQEDQTERCVVLVKQAFALFIEFVWNIPG